MLIIAHRGAHEPESPGVRENSLDAFRRALGVGADGIELDVRRTADGFLVVHHDPAPHGQGPIAEAKRDELPPWLPSLEQAVAACADLPVVHVELKASPLERGFDPTPAFAEAVAAELTRCPRPLLVSSFNLVTLDQFHAAAGEIPTSWLTMRGFDQDQAARQAAEHGHRGLNPPWSDVSAELVKLAHGMGLQLTTWTVNDERVVVDLSRWDVDAVITDWPARARAALEDGGARHQ